MAEHVHADIRAEPTRQKPAADVGVAWASRQRADGPRLLVLQRTIGNQALVRIVHAQGLASGAGATPARDPGGKRDRDGRSDPGRTTPGSGPLQRDSKVPSDPPLTDLDAGLKEIEARKAKDRAIGRFEATVIGPVTAARSAMDLPHPAPKTAIAQLKKAQNGLEAMGDAYRATGDDSLVLLLVKHLRGLDGKIAMLEPLVGIKHTLGAIKAKLTFVEAEASFQVRDATVTKSIQNAQQSLDLRPEPRAAEFHLSQAVGVLSSLRANATERGDENAANRIGIVGNSLNAIRLDLMPMTGTKAGPGQLTPLQALTETVSALTAVKSALK